MLRTEGHGAMPGTTVRRNDLEYPHSKLLREYEWKTWFDSWGFHLLDVVEL
jgi:hypothetical protein